MTALVLNWVLTSSLLIAAVLLLRAVFGRRISARLRYALWAAVLVRLLIPGQFFTAPVEAPREFPALFAAPSAASGAMPAEKTPPLPETVPAVSPAPSGEVSPPHEQPADRTAPRPADLLWVWPAGSAVMAAVLAGSNLRFARRLRRVRVPLPGADCRVYLAELPSPCLFGLLHPAVYVTQEAAADPVCLRHVLAHETAHLRQGDHLWAALRCMALTIHWWNPLVWLAAVLSRRDAELACDERTLKILGNGERRAYGNTLLRLITAKSRPGDLLRCATTMVGGKRSLRERIGRIAHAPRRWLWAAVLTAVLAALGCAFSFARTAGTRADGPLCAEELAFFNEQYFNGPDAGIRNQLLYLAVEAPKDYRQIDLYQLFYNGAGEPAEITAEERQAVADTAWGGQDPGTDLIKCTATQMDAVLREYLGLSLKETDRWGLDQFTYLEAYDAYYTFHGDTNAHGPVTFTSGERKDGNILLHYRGSDFPVLSGGDGSFIPVEDFGPACLTLEERRDGSYRFLSNWHCAPPTAPTAYPPWAPERVIPLNGLEPYLPEAVTVKRHTGGVRERIAAMRFEPDEFSDEGFTVEIYRSTGGKTCAALAVSETERDCFLETEYDAEAEQVSLEWYSDVCGHSGFLVTYPVAMGSYRTAYYYFDGENRLRRMADESGPFCAIDLDGDGQRELTPLGYQEQSTYLLFRRDGQLYRAELQTLVREAWPEAGYTEYGRWDTENRFLSLTAQLPLSGRDSLTASAFRTLWFDGENLRLYRDNGSYTDRVRDGIDAPAEVLAQAVEFVRGEFDALAAAGTGVDPDDRGNGSISDGQVTWDDWRITGLTGPYYETVGDLRVEIWNLRYEVHTTTPDRLVLAGGSYLGEDGWCMVGYPGCDYLYFQAGEENGRTFLFSLMDNDCSPGTAVFREDLLRKLEQLGISAASQPARALTRQELQSIQSYFFGVKNAELHSGLLKTTYGGFQDIGPNLKILLFDMGEPITDEAERAEAARLSGQPEHEHTKFTTQHLRACLAANFQRADGRDWLDLGVDLEKVLGPYSEKYDAYYLDHSDRLDLSHIRFEGEWSSDGTVRLFYVTRILYAVKNGEVCWDLAKQSMCATLVPDPDTEGNWLMVSNRVVEPS